VAQNSAVDQAVEKVLLSKKQSKPFSEMSDADFHEASEDAWKTVKNAGATIKHRELQDKLKRKPLPEPETPKMDTPEKSVGPIAEQDSLATQYAKKQKTDSDVAKTAKNKATQSKIDDVVASRKQISKPSGGSTKGPSKSSVEKAISLKR
jgi:hypothetical protein